MIPSSHGKLIIKKKEILINYYAMGITVKRRADPAEFNWTWKRCDGFSRCEIRFFSFFMIARYRVIELVAIEDYERTGSSCKRASLLLSNEKFPPKKRLETGFVSSDERRHVKQRRLKRKAAKTFSRPKTLLTWFVQVFLLIIQQVGLPGVFWWHVWVEGEIEVSFFCARSLRGFLEKLLKVFLSFRLWQFVTFLLSWTIMSWKKFSTFE